MRIIYIAITILSFLFFTGDLFAQHWSVGIRLGATNNHLSDDLSGRVDETDRREFDYYSGISVRYSVSKRLAIESGMAYIGKASGVYRTGIYKGVFYKASNRYFEIPMGMMVTVYDRKRFSIKPCAGGYVDYWLSSMIEGTLPNILDTETGDVNTEGEQLVSLVSYHEKKPFSAKDRRVEIGGIGGLAVELNVARQLFLSARFAYYYAFTGQERWRAPDQKIRRNSGFVFSMGCFVPL